MIRILSKYSVWLLLFFTLNGCVIPVYVATIHNTPDLEKKDEFTATISGGMTGGNLATGYSPLPNFGVFSDFTAKSPESILGGVKHDLNDQYFSHYSAQIGAGYYRQLNSLCYLEVYGGYGFGHSEGHINSEQWLFSFVQWNEKRRFGDYEKLFLQPAIKIKRGKYYKGTVAIRISYIDFYNSHVIARNDVGTFYYPSANAYAVEPTITNRIFNSNLTLFVQLGLSFRVINYEEKPGYARDGDLGWNPIIISIGGSLKLPLRKRYEDSM